MADKGKASDKGQEATILTRSHRMSAELYKRVSDEANKTGNAINSEINSLILDGLRFRDAKIIIHLEE